MAKTPIWGENSWIYDESEKKKKKRAQELKAEETAKVLKAQKQKEKIRKSKEANEELTNLKDLIEKWVVTQKTVDTAKKVANDPWVDSQETQDILRKIDDIQENEYMKMYIPNSLFISQDEYLKALKDAQQKVKTLQKVDDVLWILAQHITPTSRLGINIFWSFALLLADKNLIRAQEDHIDIKYSLKK